MLSTVLLVTGALVLGESLHGSVVTGQYAVTSPWAVFRAALGLVFIALGYRFQTPVSEYTSLPSEESKPETETTDADATDAADPIDADATDFDPEMSPLSEEDFDRLEADDER